MKSLFFDLFPATRVNCVEVYTRRDVMAPVYFKQTVGIWTVPKYGDLSTYLSLMEVSLTTFCVIIEELLGQITQLLPKKQLYESLGVVHSLEHILNTGRALQGLFGSVTLGFEEKIGRIHVRVYEIRIVFTLLNTLKVFHLLKLFAHTNVC